MYCEGTMAIVKMKNSELIVPYKLKRKWVQSAQKMHP